MHTGSFGPLLGSYAGLEGSLRHVLHETLVWPGWRGEGAEAWTIMVWSLPPANQTSWLHRQRSGSCRGASSGVVP